VTYSQATVIWQRLTLPDEGWLDAMVRLEAARLLTDRERQAADNILWAEFAYRLKVAARAASKGPVTAT
jgi:hypothetical protein